MNLDSRCVGVITLKGEGLLRNWMNANAAGMQEVTGEGLREAFGGLIGKADKEVLSGSFADDMARR